MRITCIHCNGSREEAESCKKESMEFDESLIHQWAEERGIFTKSSPRKQFKKTLEEIRELRDAIIADDLPKVIDGIGDVIVTLCILAKMYDTTANDCLWVAYKEIKDRKGEMVDGVFVREK